MPHPLNPVAAVTHPNPYPYYASLVAQRPVYRDDDLGMWIVSSAAAAREALASEHCRVRPPAEPVPASIVGSPAGELFRHLIRMSDGAPHATRKQAVAATLTSVDATRLERLGAECASRLADELSLNARPDGLQEYAFLLPVYVVSSLLGMPAERLPQIARWVAEYVACLAPSSSPGQLASGTSAAAHLLAAFHEPTASSGETETLLCRFAQEARQRNCADAAVIAANAVGLLMQSYEATAGLIGNTIIALAGRSDLRERAAADTACLREVIEEVLRHDPPVQNTRRFLAHDGVVAGQAMRGGDAILVLLAAANRDPALNADPERFDPARKERRLLTFSHGPHQCPGDRLAMGIAQSGVTRLLADRLVPDRQPDVLRYRPSANARIPLLDELWNGGRVSSDATRPPIGLAHGAAR